MTDKHIRSITKGISWRILATIITTSLVFSFTGKVMLALEVGIFEVILKILFFYIHERTWNKINWGAYSHPSEF